MAPLNTENSILSRNRILPDSPLVSIIIPAYNCADHIAEAVDSALAQDYPGKELIVVNDGSTDDTRSILESYGERIRLIDQENAGSAVARNTGLDAAQGDLIAFLDSDDYWYPGKLSLQVAYLEAHPEVGLVYNDWLVWRPDASGAYILPAMPALPEDRFDIIEQDSGWIYNRLFRESLIHTTAAMLRRDVIKKTGYFDAALRKGQDYEYWFRVSRVTPVHKLRAVLSLYRINPQSVTHRPDETNYGYLVIRKTLDRFGRWGPDGTLTPRSVIRNRLAVIWKGFAHLHYSRGNPWIATRAFAATIWNQPFDYRNWIYALLAMVRTLRYVLRYRFDTNRRSP